MVRGALAALSLAALVALAPLAAAVSAVQDGDKVPQKLPQIGDLPRLQHDLREGLKGLDKEQFTKYAQDASIEAGVRRLNLVGVDWPAVLTELRALAAERGLSEANLSFFDMSLAYFISVVQGDRFRALQHLEDVLARTDVKGVYRVEPALLAAEIERNDEHWNEARRYLGLAEAALEGAPEDSRARALFHGYSARFWIDLGMTEEARPHVEFELERKRVSKDSAVCLPAQMDELELLACEQNYSAVDERWDKLSDESWFKELKPAEQGLCQVRVAASWLEREHNELAPRGTAARMLDELRGANRIDPGVRPWVVRHAAVCAADAGEWARARALCDELAVEIGAVGAPPDYLPDGRLGEALMALEARLELALGRGAPDRTQRLRPHLERLRRLWSEFLDKWSGAPVRGGGLAYLQISERHQVLQELIELALEVEGGEAGARAALQSVLEAEQRSTLSRRMQLPHASLEEALAELTGPQAGVLVYVPTRDRSFVFALDPRGVRVFHLDATYRLRRPCEELAAAAAIAVREGRGTDDSELRAASAACAQALLPPDLEEHIEGWRELVLIGLDDIGYVPFELLPARGGGTQGERRAISYAHSIPLALYLERLERPTLDGRARLLLATELEGGGEPLALSDDEREELQESISGEVELLEGVDARATCLGREPGERVAMTYVISHGKQEPTRERPAGLVLAGASGAAAPAWAEDIESLHPAPLMVLTACGLGRARLRRGDGGRSDLAAAFLYAGASTVVLPTCDLQADATLRLVPVVFCSLAEGKSAAEAMRAARAQLSAQGDSVAALAAHVLHVVGRGRTAMPPRPARPAAGSVRWIAGGLLLAVLAVLGFALARRRARS